MCLLRMNPIKKSGVSKSMTDEGKKQKDVPQEKSKVITQIGDY